MKLNILMQSDLPNTVIKSKPEVEFQDGRGLFLQTKPHNAVVIVVL